jgi:hypothetical protein
MGASVVAGFSGVLSKENSADIGRAKPDIANGTRHARANRTRQKMSTDVHNL